MDYRRRLRGGVLKGACWSGCLLKRRNGTGFTKQGMLARWPMLPLLLRTVHAMLRARNKVPTDVAQGRDGWI
jgi:hypothetical protein